MNREVLQLGEAVSASILELDTLCYPVLFDDARRNDLGQGLD